MLRQVVVIGRGMRGVVVGRTSAATTSTTATARIVPRLLGSSSASSSSLSYCNGSHDVNGNRRLLLLQSQQQQQQQQHHFPAVFLSSSAAATTRHHHRRGYCVTSTATRSFATTTTTTNDNDSKKDKQKTEASSSSSSSPEEREQHEPENKQRGTDSLRDAVNRMQGGSDDDNQRKDSNYNDSSSSSSSSQQWKDFQRRAADWWDSFREQVGTTWQDLIKSGERKSINKKVITTLHPVATPGGDAPYTGPVDIMVIDPAEHLTAWQRMQKRLTKAPIISDILSRSEELYVKTGAQKAKQKLDHLSEDAREAWETSQNPWVYRVSSVYDTLTAETPESMAVRELRVLDPDFTLEDWRVDVVEHTLPQIMAWFLQGKINQLKPWLGESVFKRLAAEMKAREQEGVQIDTHVLGIMNSEILACEPDDVNKGSPIILLHFMCQQINCVRKKKGGEIVEGSEDDIRANSYVAAFQREYDEEKGELNWKIVDFRFNGAIAYL